jgi:4-hydroxy-2-oxoglutarate aldolase
MKPRVRGIYAPITTPFLEDGRVDTAGLRRNMEFYAKTDLAGYLALGSNGENKSLGWDEKLEVLGLIQEHKAPAQKVMAGVIFDSTVESLRFIREAEKLRPDYLTLLAPSYFAKQMTDEVLLPYFTALADAAQEPCLLYNAPQFCGGVSLSPALVAKLASHPNIHGVKDSANAASITAYLLDVKDRISVLAGSADYFLYAMTLGAAGGVLSLGNIFPALVTELYTLADQAAWDAAFKLNDRVIRLNKAVSGKGGVAAVKYAMDLIGLTGGYPRGPLVPLSGENAQAVRGFLQAQGMI